MPSFMAKWNPKYPGCSGHIHQSLKEGKDSKTNLFYDANSPRRMSALFESYVAGQVACLMEFAPMFWPTINSYKRLVDGFWAPVKPTWGSTTGRRAFASSPAARRRPGSRRAARVRRQSVHRDGGRHRRRPARRREGAQARCADHRHQRRRRDVPRAPRTLIETTRIFKASEIARDWLGDDFVDHFAATRDWEWRQWLDGVTDWEMKRYFEII
jgi:glutamine synthetase